MGGVISRSVVVNTSVLRLWSMLHHPQGTVESGVTDEAGSWMRQDYANGR